MGSGEKIQTEHHNPSMHLSGGVARGGRISQPQRRCARDPFPFGDIPGSHSISSILLLPLGMAPLHVLSKADCSALPSYTTRSGQKEASTKGLKTLSFYVYQFFKCHFWQLPPEMANMHRSRRLASQSIISSFCNRENTGFVCSPLSSFIGKGREGKVHLCVLYLLSSKKAIFKVWISTSVCALASITTSPP